MSGTTMASHETEEFDFRDSRSKKVIIASHCILNQNSRIATCAFSPATTPGILEFCVKNNIGIIQGPCPETQLLGLTRSGMDVNKLDGSLEPDDGEIYDRLKSVENIDRLREMAENLIWQAKHYLENGFEVVGILGVGGSPACGVSMTYYKTMKEGKGAFIEQLETAMEKAGISVPIVQMLENGDTKARNLTTIQSLLA